MPSDFRIINSSIVFVVDDNQPGLFSPKYLSHEGLFEDFEEEQSINAPPISKIQFEQGYLFEAAERKIKLLVDYTADTGDPIPATDEAPDILTDQALHLAGVIPFMGFSAVGMNFTVLLEQVDNIRRLVNGIPSGAEAEQVKFSLTCSDQYSANVTLNNATVPSDTGEGRDDVVLLEANFHGEVGDHASEEDELEYVKTLLEQRNWCLQKLNTIIHDTDL